MGTSLVIVESPAKAKTIYKFLGRGYQVKASMGHVCDLPAKELGVNIADDFRPKYVVIQRKRKILSELKKAAKDAEEILLATDPDREGEAIAWHVANRIAGKGDTIHRILFNEITESAIQRAVEHPLAVDMNKVNAQQARRILDRLVGYKVSPVLWKTVRGGLSAGRVQSVALRLICEREEEITRFVPKEYWSIAGTFEGAETEPFEAELIRKANRKIAIPNEEQAQAIVAELKEALFKVLDIQRKDQRRDPPPPFITSTLQQEASKKLGFPAWKTMQRAQELYEGIDVEGETTGLITYMRTDSTRMAKEAMTQAREYIAGAYGLDYIPQKPRVFRHKKGAQDAHEAIRPTHVAHTPKKIKKFLNPDQWRLYELIWRRFVACQMSPAILDGITVDIQALQYLFRASGSKIKFMGYMVLYKEAQEEGEEEKESTVPTNLHVGEGLTLLSLKPEQHFTKPPPRYSEATLIKELEAKGIGRPSTYAEILSKIQEREYVVKEKGRFVSTDLGSTVNRLLVGAFPEVFDVAFTAKMEEELDRIETGQEDWVGVVREFYDSFEQTLKSIHGQRAELKKSLQEQTDILCDQCGRKMVIKWGRRGRFLSCSGFPACKNAKPLEEKGQAPEITGEKCDQCGADMVVRSGKYGRFLACSAYPTCKNTKPITLGIPCPEPYCMGELVEKRTKRGKIFYGCSAYPTCTFATWNKPVEQTCSTCGAPFLVEKATKAKGTFLHCLSCKTQIEV